MKARRNQRLVAYGTNQIVKPESEIAKILNKFLSNIVKNLSIPVYDDFDPVIENMKDPIFKAILKYKNHSSILAIRDTQKSLSFLSKK